MINRNRVWQVALVLLLVVLLASACATAAQPMQHWPGLTVENGVLYAITGSPQQVMMFDAKTGASKGSFMPQGQFTGTLYWSPVTVVDESTAFVGFGEEAKRYFALYAFNPSNGQELWHVEADNFILDAPAYISGTVYIGTSAGSVYAIDMASHGVKPGWPFHAREAIWGSPLVEDGRVYVPSMDHHLYCLDANTGQVVWDFKAGGAMGASPQLSNGTLYQGAFDARLYAIAANSGQQVTGFDFKAGNWIWSEALAAGNRLFVTSMDGKLYALDPATGKVEAGYPQKVGDATDYLRAGPVAAGDLVIVASGEGRVVAFKADSGQVAWQWPSGTPAAGILTNPVVDGGNVYFTLTNGEVWALSADTGAQVAGWPYKLPTQQK